MKKKAKFFCENCGEEVPEKARFCRHCGKFFTATRCPKCGATGPSSAFIKGCPQCGYAAEKGEAAFSLENGNTKQSKDEDNKRRFNRIEKKRIKEAFRAASSKGFAASDATDGALPAWVYAVTGIATVAALLGVYSCMR